MLCEWNPLGCDWSRPVASFRVIGVLLFGAGTGMDGGRRGRAAFGAFAGLVVFEVVAAFFAEAGAAGAALVEESTDDGGGGGDEGNEPEGDSESLHQCRTEIINSIIIGQTQAKRPSDQGPM